MNLNAADAGVGAGSISHIASSIPSAPTPSLKFKTWKDTTWYYTQVPDWLLEDAHKYALERREFKRSSTDNVPIFQTDPVENEKVGIIGELVCGFLFARNINIRLIDRPTDMIDGGDGGADFYLQRSDDEDNLAKIDVKTVARTVVPKPHYSCVVAHKQLIRKSGEEILVFVSYTKPSRLAFVLGWLTVAEFNEKARYRRKGYRYNSFVAPTAFHEVYVRELRPISELLEWR